MSDFPRLGFIGAGRMATSLAKGLLEAGLTTPDRLFASDVLPEPREALAAATSMKTYAENRPVVQKSELVVLAVKPQVMSGVLADIKPALTSRHLVVSIAAGITIQQLSSGLGKDRRIIRVMPNTPCLVGASASAYSLGPNVSLEDSAVVNRMLTAVGRAIQLPEHLLDAVTGLSGSGPGFVAVMIEALADGGVRVGLPRDIAQVLAAQTVLGAAKLVLDGNLHPAQLKDMVASPGGTTAAGLHALEKGGLRGALIDAVVAATERSRQLGQEGS